LESNRRQEEKKVNLQKLAAVLEKDKYRWSIKQAAIFPYRHRNTIMYEPLLE
jgi:hypothetical protein